MRQDAVTAADMQACNLVRIVISLHEEHTDHHSMQLSQPGSTLYNRKVEYTQLGLACQTLH